MIRIEEAMFSAFSENFDRYTNEKMKMEIWAKDFTTHKFYNANFEN